MILYSLKTKNCTKFSSVNKQKDSDIFKQMIYYINEKSQFETKKDFSSLNKVRKVFELIKPLISMLV